MSQRTPIVTLGDVRRFLAAHADAPDDMPILAQVVAKDSRAWSMWMDVGMTDPKHWNPVRCVVTLTHPELTTMPEWPQTQEPA